MNKDFRVSVTLPTHPKALKLMRKLGDRAFYNLIRLWAFVSANKPNGDLSGYDEDDIEIAADWKGEPGEFVDTLLDKKIRFLEKTDSGFLVHDWHEHNEYAFHAPERSKKAKKAARARWGKDSGKQKDSGGNAKSCSEHKTSNATSTDKQCPSPSPNPTPSPSPDKSIKNNPGEPGIFSHPSDGFKKQVGGCFDDINQACLKIKNLPANSAKMIDPYKWVQIQVKSRGHPEAILKSLNGIISCWDAVNDSRWGYLTAIMKKENGNFNEADAIKIHNEMKNMKSNELSSLTCGLCKEI